MQDISNNGNMTALPTELQKAYSAFVWIME